MAPLIIAVVVLLLVGVGVWNFTRPPLRPEGEGALDTPYRPTGGGYSTITTMFLILLGGLVAYLLLDPFWRGFLLERAEELWSGK